MPKKNVKERKAGKNQGKGKTRKTDKEKEHRGKERRKKTRKKKGQRANRKGASMADERGADEPRGKRNKTLGARGEIAAARFLQRRGCEIIERNWTCFAGEADIVATDGETLVFVEVKTRSGIKRGFPSEAVDRAKRERYEKIALAYVQSHCTGEVAVRFDIVAIVVVASDRALVRHHIGAFTAV